MAYNQRNNPFRRSTGVYTGSDGYIYSGRAEGGGMYQGLTSDPDGYRTFYSGTNLGSQQKPGRKYGEATLGKYNPETGQTSYHFADGRKSSEITERDIDYYKKEFGYDITTADSSYKPKPKTESGSIDWQKVDKGRRQRAANTARYGMTDRESRKFQRQQRRDTRRSQRQQRREARRLERQIRRRNEGGFFSRLFG